VLSAQTNYIFNQDIQNYGATFLISETSSSESGGYITNAIKQAVASSPEIKKKTLKYLAEATNRLKQILNLRFSFERLIFVWIVQLFELHTDG